MAEVTYIAGRRLKVNGTWREPGDEVPEAATWSTLSAYLGSGALKEVATMGASFNPDRGNRKIELMGMPKNTITKMAKKAGIPVYGSKNDIIERMLTAEFD